MTSGGRGSVVCLLFYGSLCRGALCGISGTSVPETEAGLSVLDLFAAGVVRGDLGLAP